MGSRLVGPPMLERSQFICETPVVPQCHAPTLTECDGVLLAAFFGGTREGAPDVGIWLARDAGAGWSEPKRVVDAHDAQGRIWPCWNPVLFRPAGEPLFLFYKLGPDPADWWGMWMHSTDRGLSWSRPEPLPRGILGPIKNKPITLSSGAWLCPSSTEHAGWRVHLERTDDSGRCWRRIGPLNDDRAWAAIQPSIVCYPSGWMQLLCRTQQGCIAECWSVDGGEHWTPMQATPLPNPCSGTDAVSLSDGRVLLVYNHARLGGRGFWGPRSPLNVALTEDGVLWQAAGVLEDAPGEYSYPAVIQTRDGRVHVAYTWRRERIRHAVLDPRALEPVPMPEGRWPAKLARR